jgi:hypothetical protein
MQKSLIFIPSAAPDLLFWLENYRPRSSVPGRLCLTPGASMLNLLASENTPILFI